jgi:DNA polymerase-3 subunit gamma/tau
LSRCQRFDFKRISLPRIAARLRYIVDQESVEVSDQALAVVARKGDGSMRDALSTLDQVLAFCGNQVADAEVTALLGVVDRRLIAEACGAALAGEVRGVLEIVARVDGFGYSMRQFCQELIDRFRGILILKAAGDAGELLELSEAELEELRREGEGRSVSDLQRHLALLLKAESEMAHAGFPRLILEMALIKMATLAPAVPVQELLARLAALEAAPRAPLQSVPAAARPQELRPAAKPAQDAGGVPAVAAASPESARPSAAATAAPAAGGDAGDLWVGLVAFVKGKKPMLGADLEQLHPVKVTPQLLEIGCLAGSFQLRMMQDPERIAELKGLASAHFGAATVIKIAVLNEVPADAPPTLSEKKSLDDARHQAELRRDAEAHPLVAAAVALFDGEIAGVKELPKPEAEK